MFKRLLQSVLGKVDVAPSSPEASRLLETYLESALNPANQWGAYQHIPAARAILEADPPTRVAVVALTARRLADLMSVLSNIMSMRAAGTRGDTARALQDILAALIRPALPIDGATLDVLIECAGTNAWVQVPSAGIVRVAERFSKESPLSDSHRKQLLRLKARLMRHEDSSVRKLCQRIDALLADGWVDEKSVALIPGDVWADAAIADLDAADVAHRSAWQRLISYAAAASGSKPSGNWLKGASERIESIGRDSFVQRLSAWLPLVGKPGAGNPMHDGTWRTDPTILSDRNADVLKGLVWAAATVDEPIIARLLGDVADVCFKKIPMHGARCPKVANAALAALAGMKGPEPVAQLSRIQAKAKKPSAQKLVEKALATSAQKQGVSPEELEEMSVPDFELDTSGRRAIAIGDWTAEIELTPSRDVELRWRKQGAEKSQQSVPADVKRDLDTALKDVKRLVKDIDRILPTQLARIERLLLDDRTWPMEVWQARYLDHSLIAPFARRLIWQVDQNTFIPSGGGFVNARNQPVDLTPTANVRLWHPIRSLPDEVLAWRQFLEAHSITQPFKQAHREIYILTDAERQTRVYSNRFAGHIIRQHQFAALCAARGWSYHLQGQFDSHNTPVRVLRRQGMRVEFWVESVDVNAAAGAAAASDAGIFLYVATDQVRYYGGESEVDPTPLERVPPTVFSELMRDVDLFVGVCSVGNDPTWRDRGEQFGQYWQHYTFGELGETAKTRRDVLSRLLPRLKIADRATLEERFLVIRGDIRTYRIHLGSGNIQMEPNNQYLCIVPDRRALAGDDVFLPFEGDHTLSVILSKAFLLADDRNIKDSSIVSQIRVRR